MACSWVPHPPDSHFPLQNLPYGVFSTASQPAPRPGVAIGDRILDLRAAAQLEPLASTAAAKAGVFEQETLNAFMGLGKAAWQDARAAVTRLLSADEPALRDDQALQQRVMVSQADARMHLPMQVGDFTDFYACEEHARNGTGIRTGVRMLAPNWVHLPVAYHSRSSSVVVSGTPITRPRGQALSAPANASRLWKFLHGWWSVAQPTPEQRPSAALDFELEMACVIGAGNALGSAVPPADAAEHIFGLALLNDWSARDFQRWEMLPLGPFNSKNFATSLSPWIVPLAALEPFRRPAPEQRPPVLQYLRQPQRQLFDIRLQVSLQPRGQAASTVTSTNFQQLYWSPEQMVAHHTYGGCNLCPGDILGTGTISSPGPGGQGSLLELSWGGSRPVALQDSGGETRRYLNDGDTVTLSGYCQGAGFRVGFGECVGTVLPAPEQ